MIPGPTAPLGRRFSADSHQSRGLDPSITPHRIKTTRRSARIKARGSQGRQREKGPASKNMDLEVSLEKCKGSHVEKSTKKIEIKQDSRQAFVRAGCRRTARSYLPLRKSRSLVAIVWVVGGSDSKTLLGPLPAY